MSVARQYDVAVWDDVLLHLSRRTDKPRVASKPTLTLRALPPLVDAAIRKEVEIALDAAVQKCEFARDWRNRHIAQRDLSLAIDEGAAPLAPASRSRVKDAIDAIARLLNVLESHYCHSEVAYEVIDVPGSAEALLYVIRDGLAAAAERGARRARGEVRPEDWDRKPL